MAFSKPKKKAKKNSYRLSSDRQPEIVKRGGGIAKRGMGKAK